MQAGLSDTCYLIGPSQKILEFVILILFDEGDLRDDWNTVPFHRPAISIPLRSNGAISTLFTVTPSTYCHDLVVV
jgi:hypothetical protein